MKNLEAYKDNFFISSEKRLLNVEIIHQYLSTESYWAKNIPIEIVKKSIDGSCCFGLYELTTEANELNSIEPNIGSLIGFARVVTDYATFGYLADVFVLKQYRGRGLAAWLMEVIMNNPDFQGLRRWMLATKDAHRLYASFGFLPLDNPERIMAYKPFEIYPVSDS